MTVAVPNLQPSRLKNTVFWLIFLASMFIVFEVLASAALMYLHRFADSDSAAPRGEISSFSSVNLIHKVAKRTGIVKGKIQGYPRFRKETEPDPFTRPDSKFGYRSSPGVYFHTYFLKESLQSDWSSLKVKVTINEDGSRWIGENDANTKSSVYLFGDSYTFGSGVNDEHTFAYLLQQARPEWQVNLFALPGFSLTQAYLRFNELKGSITENDVIILGYNDFNDKRHVMAPSRLREMHKWVARKNPDQQDRNFSMPKVSVTNDGKIDISYIQQDCVQNKSYCDSEDPSSAEMTRTTAALINHIANNTRARVYLLHLDGDPDNPLFELTEKVTLISALAKDFDYFLRDEIEEFDTHPGPYWHYAISRKLLQVLPEMRFAAN
jgi:hypothetical protein